MPRITVEPIASYAGDRRWDAEFYASDQRPLIEAMFERWHDWESLDDATIEMSSGHTPSDHDLEEGKAGFITIDCIDPLFLDRSRLKRINIEHVEGELKRARVGPGDVVVTIKRRLLNASPILGPAALIACNQDVVRMKPKAGVLPGFLAAVLNSRIGKSQATRNATEQINPYLSVPALKAIAVPKVEPSLQAPIHELVIQRIAEYDACARVERAAEAFLADELGLRDVSMDLRRTAVSSAASIAFHSRLDAEYFCFPSVDEVWQSPYPLLRLGDERITSSLATGSTPAATDYSSDGIPIIKVGSVSAFGLAEWRGDRVRPEAPAAKGVRGDCRLNDIVMLSAAHHVRYIGRAGLLRQLPEDRTRCRAVGELITGAGIGCG